MVRYIAGLVILIAVASYGAYSASASLKYREAGAIEYNWQAALTFCERQQSRLPSILELAGLMYRGVLVQPATDYWSRTALFGYAFGANTKSYILSFDRFSDIDHVVCVRD
ncbi:MAG: hypothetical protein ACPGF7_04440 [Pontibacterium sp.]